ncbi:hypothetical protein P7C71_g3959, partial [Lecanoromycetidae sp. Uapishka_2]
MGKHTDAVSDGMDVGKLTKATKSNGKGVTWAKAKAMENSSKPLQTNTGVIKPASDQLGKASKASKAKFNGKS